MSSFYGLEEAPQVQNVEKKKEKYEREMGEDFLCVVRLILMTAAGDNVEDEDGRRVSCVRGAHRIN
jgi:hypothetical protein